MTADPDFLAGQRLPASKLLQLSADPVFWTPSWVNVTLGSSPTNNGWWWAVGRHIHYCVDLGLGTGGDVTGTMEMDFDAGMPTPSGSMVSAFVCAAWASITSTDRYAGTGIGDTGGITRFVNAATSGGWSAAQPGNWAAGSALRVQGSYIAA